MAVSYHEIRVDAAGGRVDEKGFFTGVAEYRGSPGDGGGAPSGPWQLRNVHWPAIVPPGPVQ